MFSVYKKRAGWEREEGFLQTKGSAYSAMPKA